MMIKGTPERAAVIVAVVPAAILGNLNRTLETGPWYLHASADLLKAVFHDSLGFLMLSVAACMAWSLVILMRELSVPIEKAQFSQRWFLRLDLHSRHWQHL